MWQISPLTTGFIYIKNCVPHPPKIHFWRAAFFIRLFSLHKFFNNLPLYVG